MMYVTHNDVSMFTSKSAMSSLGVSHDRLVVHGIPQWLPA